MTSLPSPECPHRSVRFRFDQSTRSPFKGMANCHRASILYAVAIGTGLRQGELLALRWSDIDLSRSCSPASWPHLHLAVTGYHLGDVEGCAAHAAQVARAALDRGYRRRTPGSSYAKAEDFAPRAAGEEFAFFMAFCGARARRLVIANVELFASLVPLALANPILTGDDVERTIAEAQQGQRDA